MGVVGGVTYVAAAFGGGSGGGDRDLFGDGLVIGTHRYIAVDLG